MEYKRKKYKLKMPKSSQAIEHEDANLYDDFDIDDDYGDPWFNPHEHYWGFFLRTLMRLNIKSARALEEDWFY